MNAASAGAQPGDPNRILASIGLVPYDWRVDTDTIAWGANAAEVLQTRNLDALATGRGYAGLLDPKNTSTRYDAVMQTGRPRCRQRRSLSDRILPADRPGRHDPAVGRGQRALVRRSRWTPGARAWRGARHQRAPRPPRNGLAYLSRFDRLTGEMNRNALTETLAVALDEAVKYRGSCGFMLIAVDNLSRINEAYGFGVADEVIASVGRRIRGRMRGGDMLGRFSSNKFGVVLKTCTPDDLTAAADRFLAAVREDVVQTAHGPVAARSRSAPSRRRVMLRPSMKFSRMRRNRSIPPRRSGAARSPPIGRMSSARPCARRTCARPTRSSPR